MASNAEGKNVLTGTPFEDNPLWVPVFGATTARFAAAARWLAAKHDLAVLVDATHSNYSSPSARAILIQWINALMTVPADAQVFPWVAAVAVSQTQLDREAKAIIAQRENDQRSLMAAKAKGLATQPSTAGADAKESSSGTYSRAKRATAFADAISKALRLPDDQDETGREESFMAFVALAQQRITSYCRDTLQGNYEVGLLHFQSLLTGLASARLTSFLESLSSETAEARLSKSFALFLQSDSTSTTKSFTAAARQLRRSRFESVQLAYAAHAQLFARFPDRAKSTPPDDKVELLRELIEGHAHYGSKLEVFLHEKKFSSVESLYTSAREVERLFAKADPSFTTNALDTDPRGNVFQRNTIPQPESPTAPPSGLPNRAPPVELGQKINVGLERPVSIGTPDLGGWQKT